MTSTRRCTLVLVLVFLLGARVATADSYEGRWPAVPEDRRPRLGDRVMDQLTAFAARLDRELDVLTIDLISLRLDPRGRGCRVRVGGGDRQLALRVAGEVHVVDGTAQIHARLDLALAGQAVHVALPRFEMAATSYRGERGIEIRLPLVRRAF
jgi:hypothetical protein